MVLTNNDITYLLYTLKYPEKDIPQIQIAAKVTKYEENGKRVSRNYVLENMDRKIWLTGIARAAFHCTSVRETRLGSKIIFDATRLFK